ncbi:flagellar export chaperone FliS [Zobellella sp. DQSA1]|uniref:flagellar export chaperone FliS n=1 Tax=Zobellella sp. DQSA1 TaxID=3342386 RepID=UPI0035C0CABB
MRGSLKAYKSVAVDSQKNVATPHKMVQMLLAGVLERLAKAKMAIEQGNTPQRGELLGRAIDILNELQAALDKDAGGEIAVNLDNLYDFCVHELLLANAEADAQRIDNVARIIRDIKEAWDMIPAEQQVVVE